MQKMLIALAISALFLACKEEKKEPVIEPSIALETTPEIEQKVPFIWEGANIYFLLTDRFNNGNPETDVNFDRTNPTGVLRGFMGGDLEGITQKLKKDIFQIWVLMLFGLHRL